VKVRHIEDKRVKGHSIHDKFHKDSPEIDEWYSADRSQRLTNFMRSGEARDTVHTDFIILKNFYLLRQSLFLSTKYGVTYGQLVFFFTSNERMCPTLHSGLYVHADYALLHRTEKTGVEVPLLYGTRPA